jgi:transposase
MEAGKRRLSGDIVREATRDEVTDLRKQNDELMRELAKLYLENKGLKKSLDGYK